MSIREWLMTWGPQLTWLVFIVAWGGCAGSLINVLVYRMPRGISVVRPPSRCPACNTRLRWKDNIPIFGWFILRGRCRYCASPISPEYPIVEAITAWFFGLFFVLWFVMSPSAQWLGVPIGAIRPEWALNPPEQVWPMFLVLLILIGSLIAMTLVDAKTFTIPIQLAWAPTIVAVAAHPAAAAWVQYGSDLGYLWHTAGARWSWAIATPLPTDWWWIGASLGAVVGIGVGLLLLATGLLRRGYADYEEWEKSVLAAEAADDAGTSTSEPATTPGSPAQTTSPTQPAAREIAPSSDSPGDSQDPSGETHAPEAPTSVVGQAPVRLHWRWLIVPGVMLIAAIVAGVVAQVRGLAPGYGVVIGLALGALPGAALWRLTGPRAEPPKESDSPASTWIAYPHARREAVREALFLAPCLALGALGGMIGQRFGVGVAPLWLTVLAGVLMGYLIGGGVVWAVRILGSLALGKEAMGLGDVHLLAAIGACLGWIDAVLTFFLATFVALYWTLLRRLLYGGFSRAMPFGPNLAAAAVLVLLCKPWIERGLAMVLLSPNPVNIP